MAREQTSVLREGVVAGCIGAAGDEYTRTVHTYYGPQGAHELLERTTWHAGQHLRQLYDLAGRLEIDPPEPLRADLFEGLPMPESVW